MQKQILMLRENLQKHANAQTKAWWESYVKGSVPFIGVKMATIRTVVHEWHKENVAGKLELPQQVDLALALFEREYTEEKLAGTIFFQEILIPANVLNCQNDIDRFAALFKNGKIYDWNIRDWRERKGEG